MIWPFACSISAAQSHFADGACMHAGILLAGHLTITEWLTTNNGSRVAAAATSMQSPRPAAAIHMPMLPDISKVGHSFHLLMQWR